MTTTTLFAGYDQPCSATISVDGTSYWCAVWIDQVRRTIESRCMAIQDDGAPVQLFRKTIHTVTAEFGPDCPKIIASGSTFVVHWLEGDLIAPAARIRKYTLDMATFATTPTWTDRSTLSVARYMHDLQPVLGHASHYLTLYVETGDFARCRRQNGFTWGSQVWDQPISDGNAVALRCVAIYGEDHTDGRVTCFFEGTAGLINEIHATSVLPADGTGPTTLQLLAGFDDAYLWQAAAARYGEDDVALVVEVSDSGFGTYSIPALAYARFKPAASTTVGDDHWVWHMRMLGRPFSYAAAREDDTDPNVYVLAGYQATTPEDEFGQRNAFVLNLDAQRWDEGGGDQTVRPRIASTHNFGDFDTRLSGSTPDGGGIAGFVTGRRCGHLTEAAAAPTSGMAVKTRTWAALGFAKLMKVDVSSGPPFQPVAATIQGLRFHIEEPTQLYRDPSDPATPGTPYFGVNPFPVGEGREAAAGVVFGGGCPSYYDGQHTTEVGFPWYPEILAAIDVGAGNVDTGTYLYLCIWEWRDSAGQLHRSAPSKPLSFELGADNRAVELTIGTLTISMKDNRFHFPFASSINAVVYRTRAGGTVFYRLFAQVGASFEPEDTPPNDPTERTITVVDSVDDSGLTDHEALYTQQIQGIFTPLPPFQPPASSAVAKWQNRIWLASSQDPRLLYFSHEILPEPAGIRSLPPEFNPSLVVRIDGIGRITAMQELDTALLVFTTDAVYSLTGGGPDGSGAGSSYQLYPILTGVGCIDQRSVVSTPDDGVFFQSRQGLYRLTPGGAFEHIDRGEQVIDIIRAGGNIRGGDYLADRAAVMWVLAGDVEGSPRTLLYDILRQRWSVSFLPEGDLPGGTSAMSGAVGGTVWGGLGLAQRHVLVQQGALMIERPARSATPYADENRAGNVSIPMRVVTKPIHLDGIAGFKRIRRVVSVLEKPNASGVLVTLHAWRPSDGPYSSAVANLHTFASPASERPKFGPGTQKCSACWIEVEELTPVPEEENLRVVGFQLEVGVKKGLGRG